MAEVVRRRSSARRKSAKTNSNTSALFSGDWLNEALSVLSVALALFILISFVSYEMGVGAIPGLETSAYGPRHNVMGPAGHALGTLLAGFFGWCALVPVLWLAWLSLYFWKTEDSVSLGSWKSEALVPRLLALAGVLGLLVFSSMLLAIIAGSHAGGSVGIALANPLERLFNSFGASLFAIAFLISSMSLAARMSVGDVLRGLATGVVQLSSILLVQVPRATVVSVIYVFKFLRQICLQTLAALGTALFSGSRERNKPNTRSEVSLPKPRLRKNLVSNNSVAQNDEDENPVEQEAISEDDEGDRLAESESDQPVDEEAPEVVVQRKQTQPKAAKALEKIWKKNGNKTKEIPGADPFADYEPPSLNLLTRGEVTPGNENDSELRDVSRLIELKLKDFGIVGKVTHIHPGPVVTLFEYEPAAGVKVGRIAALSDDLAMGLRASSIRIIAPIPKRGTVGIEVPNRHRDIVRLRDVLESEAFVSGDSILSIAMGKDTYGEPVVVDISTMPHLLMAGATGTGKSVCINALLLSLLYRASPAELGLILIDPKILELSVYDDIPHLRVPVVTVPRQAKAVLEWAVNEMNRRYRMMQKFGVRNIDSYNRLAAGEQDPETSKSKRKLEDDIVMLKEEEIIEPGIIDDGSQPGAVEAEAGSNEPEFAEQLKPLSKIVIVIDELSDLMLSVGRDIEELITRLAQKARAAGIHLIVATQRPSVDVITGLIKANFPARLSFRVSSRIDSRTILDSMGADKLLGRGDMLFMVPGGEGLRRIHGAFCSDSEVKQVVAAIKQKCKPRYDERIMAICEKALEEENNPSKEDGTSGPEEYDEMYDKCVELVLERGQASTSMLQRAFRLGYNRAARIIDMMEREGLVGPMDGAKPREVLVQTGQESEGGER